MNEITVYYCGHSDCWHRSLEEAKACAFSLIYEKGSYECPVCHWCYVSKEASTQCCSEKDVLERLDYAKEQSNNINLSGCHFTHKLRKFDP